MKTVILTGASGGMGTAALRRLVKEQYNVLAVCSRDNGFDHLDPEVLQSKHVETVTCDLSQLDSISSIVDTCVERFGAIDHVVNLAGISQGSPIESLSIDDWNRSMTVNATAPMLLSQLALPYLKQAAARGNASILNISSPVAVKGANKASYSASKAALLGLTVSLARQLGESGIRVNAILPGATITNMTKDWDEERRASIGKQSLLNRLADPDDIAGPIFFLISDDASYITGSIIDVTGGASLGNY